MPKLFKSDVGSAADLKVFVTDIRSEADLIIYETTDGWAASESQIWCYTDIQKNWHYCCVPYEPCTSQQGWCYTGESQQSWQYCTP